MKKFILAVCKFARSNVRVLLVVGLVMFGASAHATGSEDPNEILVETAVGFLTTTFATIFTLGLGVVIAMIAKKYLRKAS